LSKKNKKVIEPTTMIKTAGSFFILFGIIVGAISLVAFYTSQPQIISLVGSLLFFFFIGGFLLGLVIKLLIWDRFLLKKFWPVKVMVLIKRKHNISWAEDYAKRIIDKTGRQFWQLRTTGERIKPSAFRNIMESTKGRMVYLWMAGHGDYYPISIEEGKISPIEEDMKLFLVDGVKRAIERFQKPAFWQQYYPIIVIVLFAVAVMFVFIGAAQYMDALSTHADALRGAAQSIQEALGGIGRSVVPPH